MYAGKHCYRFADVYSGEEKRLKSGIRHMF